MIINIELLKTIREEQVARLDKSKMNAHNIEVDKKGNIGSLLSRKLETIAMIDYLVDKNIPSFRNGLAESASIYLKLFERFDAGESISPSYVSMLAYKELLDALASGDTSLSKAFAQKMGGRDAIEKEYDTPFTIAIGYTLKHLVLNEDDAAKAWLDKLVSICQQKEPNFKGYAAVIAAIINNDQPAMNAAIPALIEGHKKESKGQGMFSDLLDEHLAVWAIGLMNLAKERGLAFNADTELIPKELVQ